jgi:hypothetical protein
MLSTGRFVFLAILLLMLAFPYSVVATLKDMLNEALIAWGWFERKEEDDRPSGPRPSAGLTSCRSAAEIDRGACPAARHLQDPEPAVPARPRAPAPVCR